MGLDNVAVLWPRTGRFYEPVAADDFADFAEIAAAAPPQAGPAAALASHIAKTGTVRAQAYTELVDLLFGLEGVLFATEAAAEEEDPVIDPDGCAWIAGGLERFVAGHAALGDTVTFETVARVLRAALADARMAADQQLRWLETRLDALQGRARPPAAVDVLSAGARRSGPLLPPVHRPRLRGLRGFLIRRTASPPRQQPPSHGQDGHARRRADHGSLLGRPPSRPPTAGYRLLTGDRERIALDG